MRRVSGVQGAVRSAVLWWWEHWQAFGRVSGGVPCVDASRGEAEEARGW